MGEIPVGTTKYFLHLFWLSPAEYWLLSPGRFRHDIQRRLTILSSLSWTGHSKLYYTNLSAELCIAYLHISDDNKGFSCSCGQEDGHVLALSGPAEQLLLVGAKSDLPIPDLPWTSNSSVVVIADIVVVLGAGGVGGSGDDWTAVVCVSGSPHSNSSCWDLCTETNVWSSDRHSPRISRQQLKAPWTLSVLMALYEGQCTQQTLQADGTNRGFQLQLFRCACSSSASSETNMQIWPLLSFCNVMEAPHLQ